MEVERDTVRASSVAPLLDDEARARRMASLMERIEGARAVMKALDGDVPVVAAVKSRFDIPFLDAVRAHPNTILYMITIENRDDLLSELLQIVRNWRN